MFPNANHVGIVRRQSHWHNCPHGQKEYIGDQKVSSIDIFGQISGRILQQGYHGSRRQRTSNDASHGRYTKGHGRECVERRVQVGPKGGKDEKIDSLDGQVGHQQECTKDRTHNVGQV
eukprot:scaffold5772_cov188-Amphora_coffeaeformis.AAC.12